MFVLCWKKFIFTFLLFINFVIIWKEYDKCVYVQRGEEVTPNFGEGCLNFKYFFILFTIFFLHLSFLCVCVIITIFKFMHIQFIWCIVVMYKITFVWICWEVILSQRRSCNKKLKLVGMRNCVNFYFNFIHFINVAYILQVCLGGCVKRVFAFAI